jgi:hypothetical protein
MFAWSLTGAVCLQSAPVYFFYLHPKTVLGEVCPRKMGMRFTEIASQMLMQGLEW